MKIGPLENRPIGLPIEDPGRQNGAKPTPEEKTDRIDISTEARAKLEARRPERESEQSLSVTNTTDSSRTPAPPGDRLDLVRRRIETGFYDSPEVRLQIADRLSKELLEE